jgi:hypothetical protein
MRIEDLTPYTYSRRKGLENAIAIGWIGGDDLLRNVGDVPVEVVKILKDYEVKNLCRGTHMCEYCSEWGVTRATGNGEIWVVKGDKLYIAPYLIIHYIEEHKYQPPAEFIDAVLNGFRPHSPGYEMRINKIMGEWKTF